MTNESKHIILTQDDLALNCKDVPFYDVNITMFPTVDRMELMRADTVTYKYVIDNPDIPYMSRVIMLTHKKYVKELQKKKQESELCSTSN